MRILKKITLSIFGVLLIFSNILYASSIDYEIRDLARGKIKNNELNNILKKEDVEYIIQIKESKKEKVVNKSDEISSIASWQKKNKNRIILEMSDPDVASFVDYSMIPMISVRSNKKFLKKMLSHPDVVAIFENKIYEMHTLQSLPLINQPQVLAQGHTGVGTSIAVLDTGIDYTRNEFGNCTTPNQPVGQCKVVFAQDFAADDGALDDNGHGTNVAGIASAVAPGADILSLDISLPGGGGFTDTNAAMNAMNWVMANRDVYNIKVVNNSWGDSSSNPSVCVSVWEPIITDLKDLGIASVFSSGNNGHINGVNSPSCTAGVISVGAVFDSNVGVFSNLGCTDSVTFADKVTCFSNSSNRLDLLAPGAWITAGGPAYSGTSQAAPHVAGAIAVMKAQDVAPNDSVDQTVARLVNKGTTITDHRNNLPKPRLDLAAAVNDAISTPPPSTDVPDECQAGGTPRNTGVVDDGVPVCVTSNTNGQFGFYADSADVGKSIRLRTAHGSGEVTIYFKAGSSASPSNFDVSSNAAGTEDTVITTITQVGWQYINVYGNNHSGVTFLFDYSNVAPPPPPSSDVPDECQAGGTPRNTGVVDDGVPVCVTSNTNGQFGFYADSADVGKSIRLRTAHGSGEVTIYFKAGSSASPSNFDVSSNAAGTEDTVITTITQVGWQYINVYGNNHSGVTFLFDYQ